MKALFTLYANPIQFLIKSFLCTVISLDFNAHMDVVWIVFSLFFGIQSQSILGGFCYMSKQGQKQNSIKSKACDGNPILVHDMLYIHTHTCSLR